jgi:hypothetical protein
MGYKVEKMSRVAVKTAIAIFTATRDNANLVFRAAD